MDDETLQSMVMAELEWEPRVNAAHIGVAARNGVVTLSGFVESYAEKLTAEEAARRVHGVQAIAEEIAVRLPSAHKRSDDEIAERALRILNWDIEVPDRRIQVKVEKGVVTLTGDVDRQFQRDAAQQDVRKLSGVVLVRNEITLKPKGGPAVDPTLLHGQIENAFRRNAELEASHIDIAVAGGKVTLRGRVKTRWERDTAENSAWAAPGVTQVNNQLLVQA